MTEIVTIVNNDLLRESQRLPCAQDRVINHFHICALLRCCVQLGNLS